MTTGGKTFLDDQESLAALIEAMPEDDQAVYKGYGALSLESAFPGRKMVVYTFKSRNPSDIEILSFGQLTVDWDMGPALEVKDSRGTTQVSAIPKRLHSRDLFLHVPQSFELKYRGRRVPESGAAFISHYAVLIKTRSKEHLQVDGHTYCVTLNKFRERFPDLKLMY